MALSSNILRRKLNGSINWQLASTIAEHQTRAALRALRDRVQQVSDKIGHHMLNGKFVKTMKRLEEQGFAPPGWLVREVDPSVKLEEHACYADFNVICIEDKARKFTDATHHRVAVRSLPRAGLMPTMNSLVFLDRSLFDELHGAQMALANFAQKSSSIQRDIYNQLSRMSTIKQLLEVWPEAEPAVAAHFQEDVIPERVERPLSSIVNRHLGLLGHTPAVEVADEVCDPA